MGGLVILAIALGSWQTRSRNGGHSDLISKFVRWAVDGPSGALSSFLTNSSDFSLGLFHSGELKRENEKLKQIAEAESLYNFRLSELQNEIDDLRKLTRMPSFPGRTRIPARVIGIFPVENRFTLNVGAEDGITPGIPVVAPDGLLGVVQTADSHSSQALLICSPLPFKIGAIVVHQPETAGLLHGESQSRLILDLGLGEAVSGGDLVITSGYSEKIPRGIPIGRVVSLKQNLDYGTEQAVVAPSAQMGAVQEVVVLK